MEQLNIYEFCTYVDDIEQSCKLLSDGLDEAINAEIFITAVTKCFYVPADITKINIKARVKVISPFQP